MTQADHATPGRVVILGGHGKVALRAAGMLAAAGHEVASVIRDPGQADDVRAAGGEPLVLDIETADTDALAAAFAGSSAVVFSAGAGGGDPARTRAVDHDAATRAMAAAEASGIARFVMVSYDRADDDVHRVDPDAPIFPYAKAKHDADAHLRATGLDYTILGPGRLTEDAGSGRIARSAPGDPAAEGDRRRTSRDNVAAVIAHVVGQGAALRDTVRFYDGDTPIAEAIPD